MRRLSKRKALTLVKELDAFPKVPESYVESSASGGTVSLLAFTLIAVLALLEFFVYRDTWMNYEYEVDKDFNRNLRINMDITVAMKCQDISADALELRDTLVDHDSLTYEPVNFDLTPQQEEWRIKLLHFRHRLRLEHALQDVLFKAAIEERPPAPPKNEDDLLGACRIHGHVYVRKVAGNVHILAGKSVKHPRGHAHVSHFINEELIPGMVSPLDGTEKVTAVSSHMFQYFVTIVPTRLNTHRISANMHQFSITEQDRVINHIIGSHGIPGIFMRYDISSLMVKVTETHMPFWKFLVRLCGIIGGIFSTTGILHGVLGFLADIVCCRFQIGPNRRLKEPPEIQQPLYETLTSLEN
ncbi:endoplasmic reticulum-Golgi intermediate compartment protein 2-like isoform X2 [Cheilinus undulatus]|uniref:endoplasmic reticulum-Golgi intermediate compartment protein 2-like isoform X2 n=1 Tax=Cheilinus undulatus TaxID=241271 RepID=UPI001BD40564|nr:endoplasmic reticulum-Golgi intermediate compartment protein 2-like isoform X2 [Cheilinus undulatus]